MAALSQPLVGEREQTDEQMGPQPWSLQHLRSILPAGVWTPSFITGMRDRQLEQSVAVRKESGRGEWESAI